MEEQPLCMDKGALGKTKEGICLGKWALAKNSQRVGVAVWALEKNQALKKTAVHFWTAVFSNLQSAILT